MEGALGPVIPDSVVIPKLPEQSSQRLDPMVTQYEGEMRFLAGAFARAVTAI